jgi:hypothetical protein
MSMTTLFVAPCPFCGETPVSASQRGFSGFVRCTNPSCRADGPVGSVGINLNAVAAVAAWNRRAPPLTPDAIASITKQRLTQS